MDQGKAEIIVDKIFEAISGRKGFDMRSLSDDIQQDIKNEMMDIIEDVVFGEME